METENKEQETAGEKTSAKKPSSKKEDLLREIESLKAQIAERDDKYLRMAAEYDNFRRRSREERDATYETAMAETVAELLPIIDNLERAANYDDGEKVKELQNRNQFLQKCSCLGVLSFTEVTFGCLVLIFIISTLQYLIVFTTRGKESTR